MKGGARGNIEHFAGIVPGGRENTAVDPAGPDDKGGDGEGVVRPDNPPWVLFARMP